MNEQRLTRGDNRTADERFPRNSERERQQTAVEEERVPLAPIVRGPVRKQKKNLIEKALGAIFGESESVGDYIIHDVLIPAIKATITDMVTGGIEVALFGERRSANIKRAGSKSYTSYQKYYDGNRDEDRRYLKQYSEASRTRQEFSDIVFEARPEAEAVLSHLVDLTIEYGVATVADFYDLSGIESKFTDNKYGWTTLRDATTDRVRNGYVIRFPQPRPLD